MNYKVLTGLALAGAFTAANLAYVYGTEREVEFTVDRTERVVNDDSSRYLVFTEGDDVYENTDSFLRLKFDSSNVYAQIDEGEEYQATVYGWRVPFFSMYPNIASVSPQ